MKIPLSDGREMYIDENLKTNLDIVKKAVKKDWDFIFIVDGYEGSGKSVFAMQLGCYLDPNIPLDRIVFSPEEFAKQVVNSKKYDCIVYDEARSGLNARRAMSQVNIVLTNMLAEIRQKNLFVVIVLPTFFDLDRNVACWRARGLFHVYTKGFTRGYWMYWGMDKKKSMYMWGKKGYQYNVKSQMRGRFTNFYALDEAEYRKKKHNTLKAYDKEVIKVKTEEQLKKEIRRRMELDVMKRLKNRGLNDDEIGEIFDVSKRTIEGDRAALRKQANRKPQTAAPNTDNL